MTHLFVGLVLAGLGLLGIVTWWNMFGLVMRGVVPFCLLVLGLVAILSSFRRVAGGQAIHVDVDLGEDGELAVDSE